MNKAAMIAYKGRVFKVLLTNGFENQALCYGAKVT